MSKKAVADEERKAQIDKLRRLAAMLHDGQGIAEEVSPYTLGTDLKLAAAEIESLADQLDHRMSDQLATGVMSTMFDVVKRETGYDAQVGPFTINNNGFQGKIVDQHPDGYVWHISCHRLFKVEPSSL